MDFGGNATSQTSVDNMSGLHINKITFDVSGYTIDASGPATVLYIGSGGIDDEGTAGTNTLTGNIAITLTDDPTFYDNGRGPGHRQPGSTPTASR